MPESFRSFRKFSKRSMITEAPFEERLFHHKGRDGHEDRITKKVSNLKKSGFRLRALRVLRGEMSVSLLVAALPRCASALNKNSTSVHRKPGRPEL
jgi:hypothetical protein